MSTLVDMGFHSPCLDLTIEEYPLGGSRRGQCRFWIEIDPRKGSRAVRQTTGKPKLDTYAIQAAIVTGSNGRTYVLRNVGSHISIRDHAFMHFDSAFPGDAQYSELLDLIKKANA